MDLQRYYERWYGSLSGEASRQTIQTLCAEAMDGIFGYYALQMAKFPDQINLLENSRITAGFYLWENLDDVSVPLEKCIQARSGQLPIATDNVDLVIASHVLEFSTDPHQVLREIDRVLVPEGHCILVGFNPFSLRRIRHAMISPEKPGSVLRKLRAAHRVKDWFSLLGFEILDVRYLGFRPAVNHPGLFGRLERLESIGQKVWPFLGSLYMIHAKKHVIAMRPHKKVWKAPAVLTGGKVALNNTARKIRRQNFGSF